MTPEEIQRIEGEFIKKTPDTEYYVVEVKGPCPGIPCCWWSHLCQERTDFYKCSIYRNLWKNNLKGGKDDNRSN